MNIATKMMFTALGLLLFVSAAAAGVQLFRGNYDALNEVDAAISSRDRNLVVSPMTVGEETVDGASVVQSVFQRGEMGADIEVDGDFFAKDTSSDETDISRILLHATYTVGYERDSQGKLQRVIFTKK